VEFWNGGSVLQLGPRHLWRLETPASHLSLPHSPCRPSRMASLQGSAASGAPWAQLEQMQPLATDSDPLPPRCRTPSRCTDSSPDAKGD
jgi:hypothetical protein